MTSRLSARVIWKCLRPQFRKHAKEGNVLRMFGCADSSCSMAIFQTNLAWFKERGLMERALLLAWNNQNFTILWGGWMRLYLQLADRQRLLEASDPLPEGDTFTIYRGVGDTDHKFQGQRVGGLDDGISWTFSLDVARRFARGLGVSGRVLAMDIWRNEILAYLGHPEACGDTDYRREEEILIIPDPKRIRVHEVVEAGRA